MKIKQTVFHLLSGFSLGNPEKQRIEFVLEVREAWGFFMIRNFRWLSS